MRDKLIELLENLEQEKELLPDERAADYLIANGVTVQKWIPVSEPPIEDGVYLCLFEDGSASSLLFETEMGEKGEFGFRQAYYDHESLGYVDSEWWCADAVTHWMPMPEPPKEGE